MNQNNIISLKDAISELRLLKLHPKVQPIFRAFIHECEQVLGITLRITQGLRTFAEQEALYAQGRTAPGQVVTNAKAGSSYHNYGLAIDICVLPASGGVDWNYYMGNLLPIAEKHLIAWGGNFVNLVDRPHWEVSFGLTWKALLNLHNAGKVTNGYVNI